MRLAPMQWLLWWLATAGKLFEGLIVFLGGLALPLVAARFELGPTGQGLVSAATLAGILVGALVLGGVADRCGRRPVFIGEMLLLALALLAAGLSASAGALVAALFVVGLALGADYPTAHLMLSESIPAGIRGRLVLAAFGFQALGAWLGTLVAALLRQGLGDLFSWRLFYLLPVIPVLLVAWGRLWLPETSPWLLSRGRWRQAEQQLRRLLGPDAVLPVPVPAAVQVELQGPVAAVPMPMPVEVELAVAEQVELQVPVAAAVPVVPMPMPMPVEVPQQSALADGSSAGDWQLLFRQPLQRATILATVPWFLQDLCTYGIGIFTPVLLAASYAAEAGAPGAHPVVAIATAGAAVTSCAAAVPSSDPAAGAAAMTAAAAALAAACSQAAGAGLGNGAGPGVASWIGAEGMAIRGTILVEAGLLLGIAGAIALADRCGRIPLQILGFLGCALGLTLAAIASGSPQRPGMFLLALLLVQFMTNLGPNAQTYLLAGELFPTPLRGLGSGLAAAGGKLGAVLTAGLFPTLLGRWGMQRLLLLLVVTSLLGALVTWWQRLETAGRPLE